MCQLLAISSNRDVDILFSFRGWRHRGKANPHGYGFAFTEGERMKVVKAASNLNEALPDDTEEIVAARSRLFLAHVRLMTTGAQDGINTHPFQAVSRGTTFTFAHNGRVDGVKKRPLRNGCSVGETDSEHAFLWLLEQLESVSSHEFAPRLKALADDLRSLGTLNFLLTDGETIWAYADDRLHFIKRRPPYGGELVRLQDDGYSISLAEVKNPAERAILIATAPLTDEPGWQRMTRGELLIVRDGEVQELFGI